MLFAAAAAAPPPLTLQTGIACVGYFWLHPSLIIICYYYYYYFLITTTTFIQHIYNYIP
jgi:hypothetical protein